MRRWVGVRNEGEKKEKGRQPGHDVLHMNGEQRQRSNGCMLQLSWSWGHIPRRMGTGDGGKGGVDGITVGLQVGSKVVGLSVGDCVGVQLGGRVG
jgi:hypothetical protein